MEPPIEHDTMVAITGEWLHQNAVDARKAMAERELGRLVILSYEPLFKRTGEAYANGTLTDTVVRSAVREAIIHDDNPDSPFDTAAVAAFAVATEVLRFSPAVQFYLATLDPPVEVIELEPPTS